jgi:hypothetical protein
MTKFTPNDLLRFRAMAMAQRCMPATKETSQPVEPAKPKLPRFARSKYQPHVGFKQLDKQNGHYDPHHPLTRPPHAELDR